MTQLPVLRAFLPNEFQNKIAKTLEDSGKSNQFSTDFINALCVSASLLRVGCWLALPCQTAKLLGQAHRT